MTQIKHAPLPWKVNDAHPYTEILDADNNCVACNTTYYPAAVPVEDQEFIVLACNFYYKLLDLLTLALPYVEEGEEFNKHTQRKLSKKIRDIITKEGGK